MPSYFRSLAVTLLAAGAVAGAARAQVYCAAGDVPVVRTPTTQSTIHVSGGPASLNGVRVVVRLSHQCDSDLDIVLVHNGTYLRLSSGNGAMGHSYMATRFADTAPRAIYEGQAPFNGTFRPEGGVLVPFESATPLPADAAAGFSSFYGQSANGDWTLWVDDTADGYVGTLEYWSLEFNGAVDANGPAMEYGPPAPGTWVEQGDAGDVLGSAQTCAGNGDLRQIVGSLTAGDADLYQIQVCDPANFSATTIGGAYFDTRLFLFDSMGNGISFNDEEPGPTSQSVVSPVFLPTEGGLYYLGVSAAGKTPVDQWDQFLWLDEPAVAERQPDGPGALHPLARWSGWPQGGLYRVTLTGACFAQSPCSTDFDGDGDNGTDADIMAFFRCLQGDCCPDCASADVDQDGDVGTDADITAFFRVFTQGC